MLADQLGRRVKLSDGRAMPEEERTTCNTENDRATLVGPAYERGCKPDAVGVPGFVKVVGGRLRRIADADVHAASNGKRQIVQIRR